MRIQGYMIKFKELALLGVALVLLALCGCERRELYVYGNEYHSVELDVDWRRYVSTDPDGMTVWFYPLDDPSHEPYRTTSANVRHQEIYLPGGRYQGVVIDYSPEEYSRQQFLGLSTVQTARVEATPATYQPDAQTVVGEGVPAGVSERVNAALFTDSAWTARQGEPPAVREETGLLTVASQPEPMGLDTLLDKTIRNGKYGDYIPWEESEEYQSSISVTKLYSEPESIIWKLRVRVWIRSGFSYLWQTQSSVSGLADGHFLALDAITDTPCLLAIDSWELERTGTDSGYVEATISTFGLRPATVLPDRELHEGASGEDPDLYDYYTGNCLSDDIRLSLAFVLRDHATLRTYHFDVGHRVVSYDNQRVLRIDLDRDFFNTGDADGDPDGPDPIDLPFAEAYNGTGFGADVSPWEEEPPVDVSF